MRKLLCLIILFRVTGCASTDLTGYVDPAYQHHNLGKTIICIKGADMAHKRKPDNRRCPAAFFWGG